MPYLSTFSIEDCSRKHQIELFSARVKYKHVLHTSVGYILLLEIVALAT